MSITKIFWLWLIVWVVFFGLGALINGAGLLSLIFGYSIMSVIAAFLSTLIHFGVQQFLKKDSITPSLRSQHPDTHNTTNAPKITSDRIQKVIDNLLDEAVKAASQSEWAEVARICGEVTNLDDDNSEAARLLKAAQANLGQVIELPTVEPTSVTTGSLEIARLLIEHGADVNAEEQSYSKTDFVQLNSRMAMARIAVGVAVIALIASIVATISEINLYNKIDDWLSLYPQFQDTNNRWFDTEIPANDSLQTIVSVLILAAYSFSVIAFLNWLHAAHSNLRIIGASVPKSSPGWWFGRLGNLLKSYQIMKEVWVGSSTTVTGDSRNSATAWSWLGWFWGAPLLIIWGFLRTALGTDDIQLLLLVDYVYVFGSGITIIAGILLFLFITKITKKQDRQILELV